MPEFAEGQQPTTPPVETLEQQIAYEDKQATLGREWAAIYSDPNRQLVNTAEIVLRNPAVYLRNLDRHNPPEQLRTEWLKISALADVVSTAAAVKSEDWGNIKGLDRIQNMVFRGAINPDFRGTVGDLMRVSSDLFSRSVKLAPGSVDYQPGMEEYYQGNVAAAEGWIRDYRQVQSTNTPQQV